jgi:hypothetical protein
MQTPTETQIDRKFIGKLEGRARAIDIGVNPKGAKSITVYNHNEPAGFIGISPEQTHLSIISFPERPYTESFQVNLSGVVIGKRSHTGQVRSQHSTFESRAHVTLYFTEAQRVLDHLSQVDETSVYFDFSAAIPEEHR